jgi:hypothetical protein
MEFRMQSRVHVVEHKGKKIFLIDCSNCSAVEQGKVASFALPILMAEPHGSVLLLVDFTGAPFDRKAVEHLKPVLVLDRPHLKRSAWVGAEALPKVFHEHLKVFSRRDLPIFKTREEALDWLVEEGSG